MKTNRFQRKGIIHPKKKTCRLISLSLSVPPPSVKSQMMPQRRNFRTKRFARSLFGTSVNSKYQRKIPNHNKHQAQIKWETYVWKQYNPCLVVRIFSLDKIRSFQENFMIHQMMHWNEWTNQPIADAAMPEVQIRNRKKINFEMDVIVHPQKKPCNDQKQNLCIIHPGLRQ